MLQGTDISFLQTVQTSSGTHPDSYLVGSGVPLLQAKWAGLEI